MIFFLNEQFNIFSEFSPFNPLRTQTVLQKNNTIVNTLSICIIYGAKLALLKAECGQPPNTADTNTKSVAES